MLPKEVAAVAGGDGCSGGVCSRILAYIPTPLDPLGPKYYRTVTPKPWPLLH